MHQRNVKNLAVACIVAMLAAFAALSYSAVVTKTATAAEPLTAVAGYVRLFDRDSRVDVEDPPLFQYWAMVPHARGSLAIDKTSPYWHEMLHYMWRQWAFVTPTLY